MNNITLTYPETVRKTDTYPPYCLNLVEFYYKQVQFGILDNFVVIWWKNGHKSGVYPIFDTTTLLRK